MKNRLSPNEFTIAAALKAFTLLGNEKLGRALRGYSIENGFCGDVFVSNPLIDIVLEAGFSVGC